MTFTVGVVLEEFELTDDALDAIFTALPDAVPSDIAGLVTVTAPVEADDPETAAFALIERLAQAVPGAVPARLDQDLVSIPDVAERVGRSRESVRLLVEGRRGPGGFPAPVGTVGDGIRVWPWASVLGWFASALGEDLGERGVPPEAAAVVDSCLSARRRLRHHQRVQWSDGVTAIKRTNADRNPYRVRSATGALVA